MKNKYTFLLLVLLFAGHLAAQKVSSTDTTTVYTMRGTYYSDRFVGRKTSNGEIFNQHKYTAAHHSFKFGTLLLVTNPKNNKQVIVRVNDRCPVRNVVDMTRRAAKQIGVGSLMVKVQVLPERYYPFWESQEDYLEVLAKGEFLKYVNSSDGVRSWGKLIKVGHVENDADSKSQSEGNSRWDELNKSMQGIDYQLYDIELCQCNSRNTAKKQVEQLPIYYQDRVEYKTVTGSNIVIVRLMISSKMDKAEQVLEEVKKLFPDAKIVKSK